jgi:hypothetical protein
MGLGMRGLAVVLDGKNTVSRLPRYAGAFDTKQTVANSRMVRAGPRLHLMLNHLRSYIHAGSTQDP